MSVFSCRPYVAFMKDLATLTKICALSGRKKLEKLSGISQCLVSRHPVSYSSGPVGQVYVLSSVCLV